MITKQTNHEKNILSTLKHYKDEPISTTELQYLTGINYYGLKIALENLEALDKITKESKGISSYWKLNQSKAKGRPVLR